MSVNDGGSQLGRLMLRILRHNIIRRAGVGAGLLGLSWRALGRYLRFALFPIALSFSYAVVCTGPDGTVKWRDGFKNLVVNTGLDDALTQWLKGSGYTADFYVGLTDGSPTVAAGNTMASHAGWSEVTAYTGAGSPEMRPSLTLGSVSSQSVDNSASTADFAINSDSTTIGGAFVTTGALKGDTAGTLIGVGAFTGGDKAADDGDTLSVTVTVTAAAG